MKKKSFYISIVSVTLFFLGLIFLPLANASDDEIFSNHNIRAVQNLKTTTFKLTRPMFITSIETYHWNDQKGKTPGKIGIRGVGLWQAKGSPGMHNTPNAYWTAHPNIRLEPGIYAITDSDPATWSQNSGSGGFGFVKVFGKPVNGSSSTPSQPIKTSGAQSFSYKKQGNYACYGQASYPEQWKDEAICNNYGCNFGKMNSLNECLDLADRKGAKEVIYGVGSNRKNECWLQNSCGDKRVDTRFINYMK